MTRPFGSAVVWFALLPALAWAGGDEHRVAAIRQAQHGELADLRPGQRGARSARVRGIAIGQAGASRRLSQLGQRFPAHHVSGRTLPFRRNHHIEAFPIWMAGAGVKKAYVYGATDEFGFAPVSGGVHVHDIQATILHRLGLDHEQLTYRFQGRDFRLTDVKGKVIEEIVA